MPIREIDRRAVRAEARELIKTASVPPLKLMALLLLICLGLDEISTVAGWFFQKLAPYDLNVFPPVLPRLGPDSLSLLFVSILTALLGTVLRAGFTGYCLGVRRGRAMPYTSLFDAFSFAGKVILLTFAQGVLVGLGLFFFVIPGVYAALAYAFALYHLCEDPEISVFEAMRRSRVETAGYKGQLLVLNLSFVPLLLLVAVPVVLIERFVLPDAFLSTIPAHMLHTLADSVLSGCASLYLEPYLELSRIGFYLRVTEPDTEEEPLTVESNSDENEENRLE